MQQQFIHSSVAQYVWSLYWEKGVEVERQTNLIVFQAKFVYPNKTRESVHKLWW